MGQHGLTKMVASTVHQLFFFNLFFGVFFFISYLIHLLGILI